MLRFGVILAGIMAFTVPLAAAERYFGEPVALKSRAMHFTSWITVGRRSIGRAVSRDFRHFSPPELVVSTDADMPPSHVFYTNGKTTLPGAPDNHVMFPWVWELENDGGAVWLLSSADGWTWSRVPGGPVVSPGQWGEPDGAFVTCSGNLLVYPGEKWGIDHQGRPIMLRVQMKQAKLFGFEFVE